MTGDLISLSMLYQPIFSGDGEMMVTLFAKNLLDEVARNHSSFVKDQVPLPGRNIGLRFNMKF